MRAATFLVLIAFAAGAAQAQQLYRWTDEKGRVHVTDTPPPPSAKSVQTRKPAAAPSDSGQESFELATATKDFPVVLYTSPNCKEPCVAARSALNKRGVPFREVQVWNEQTAAELKKVSSAGEVPTLMVGRSVHIGFEQGAFDQLLDSARYPKAGQVPARAQAAPPVPEGYVAPADRAEPLKAEPVKPAAQADEGPRGPYAPGAPPQRRTQPVTKKAQ